MHKYVFCKIKFSIQIPVLIYSCNDVQHPNYLENSNPKLSNRKTMAIQIQYVRTYEVRMGHNAADLDPKMQIKQIEILSTCRPNIN